MHINEPRDLPGRARPRSLSPERGAGHGSANCSSCLWLSHKSRALERSPTRVADATPAPRPDAEITVSGAPVVGQIDNERPSSQTYATATPHCDSDGAQADSDQKLAPADVVPMHRMQRVGPSVASVGRPLRASALRLESVASRLGCRVSPRGVARRRVAGWRWRRGGAGRGGPPGAQAAAVAWRWSLRRLWVAVISRHSVRTAPRPRRLKRSRPRLNFICANTGSIIGWRLR